MTRKFKIVNSKSIPLFVLVTSLFVLGFIGPQQLFASSNNDNEDCREKPFPQDIACALGDAATGYDNGYSAGKSAGINGDSSSCPQSDGLSGYCLGWNDGYRDGADARQDVERERNQNSDDGEFEDDD